MQTFCFLKHSFINFSQDASEIPSLRRKSSIIFQAQRLIISISALSTISKTFFENFKMTVKVGAVQSAFRFLNARSNQSRVIDFLLEH